MTSYKVVAIDVHKKMLAVAVADVGKDEWEVERRKFGTTPSELKALRSGWQPVRCVRSGDGIDGAVLEACMAAIGRTLPAAPGASTFESGTARPEA